MNIDQTTLIDTVTYGGSELEIHELSEVGKVVVHNGESGRNYARFSKIKENYTNILKGEFVRLEGSNIYVTTDFRDRICIGCLKDTPTQFKLIFNHINTL